jgi:hypothetical protein
MRIGSSSTSAAREGPAIPRLAAIEHSKPTITGRKAAPGRTEYKHFCLPMALDVATARLRNEHLVAPLARSEDVVQGVS